MLKTTYKTEEEIPEAHRELFTEGEDGTWTLTGVEGVKTAKDVETLDKSLKAERAAHKKTKERILAFGELTPEKVVELNDTIEDLQAQLAAGGKPDEKALEPLIARRAESLVRPVTRERDAVIKERDALKIERDELAKERSRRRLNDALRGATVGDKGVKLRAPTVLDDVELLAERVFVEDEAGNMVTKDGITGLPGGLPPIEWLREVQSAGTRAHWFPENEGAGAGGGKGGGGGAGPDPFTPVDKGPAKVDVTAWGKLVRSNPKRAVMLAQKHGRVDLLPANLKPAA